MNRRNLLKKSALVAAGLMVAPSSLMLLESCRQERRSTWAPQLLNQNEARFVTEIVDMILPRTDTPGAIDMNVDIFLDKLWARTTTKKEQEVIRTAIAELNQECKTQNGADFVDLDTTLKTAFLEHQERTSGQIGQGVWGKAVGNPPPVKFYRSLKATAIWAFETSEQIGEKVLNYLPVPGEYVGCVPLEDIGHKWSL